MKMLNRCQPCGQPVFEDQKWVPVGKGRLQHLLCVTGTPPPKKGGANGRARTEGTRASERTPWSIQEAATPRKGVVPIAFSYKHDPDTILRFPVTRLVRRLARLFHQGRAKAA